MIQQIVIGEGPAGRACATDRDIREERLLTCASVVPRRLIQSRRTLRPARVASRT